jgi:hypothetical protein
VQSGRSRKKEEEAFPAEDGTQVDLTTKTNPHPLCKFLLLLLQSPIHKSKMIVFLNTIKPGWL